MTTRHTCSAPTSLDIRQLHSEANAVAPGCLDVNLVEPSQVAAYWSDSDAPTVDVWIDVVRAHTPAPDQVETSAAATAASAIAEEVADRISPTDVNSIAELKTAIRDGLAAAVDRLA